MAMISSLRSMQKNPYNQTIVKYQSEMVIKSYAKTNDSPSLGA